MGIVVDLGTVYMSKRFYIQGRIQGVLKREGRGGHSGDFPYFLFPEISGDDRLPTVVNLFSLWKMALKYKVLGWICKGK